MIKNRTERKKKYLQIVNSSEYFTELDIMAKRIIINSKTAPNEATIEGYFDCELFAFFKETFDELGFVYNPVKEKSYDTGRHILKGRADTAITSLIVEFKQPKTLSNKKSKDNAIKQISDYLIANEEENENVSEGFITDGVVGCFLQCSDGIVTSENFYKIDGNTLDRIIKCIIQVKLVALNAKNLVDGLCVPPENNGVAFRLMKVLFNVVNNAIHPKTKMLFEEWQQLFNLAHDDVSKQQAIIDRKKALEQLFNTKFPNVDDEYKALFSLQTAYAIIVKCIAYKVVSQVKYNASLIDFYDSMEMDSETLRVQMCDLENGSVFIQYGITNLLEGDFFSWYTNEEQWNDEIGTVMSDLFEVLSRYSEKNVTNSTEKSQDFFKSLYESMVPAAVRHSLGEYYTKKWLAEAVVREAVQQKNETWKALDPCCGSGTFLTVLIDDILVKTEGMDNEQRLVQVLERVKGIDLNPLAVLTARVNYFINISFLMNSDETLEIPVYLGDASYVPQEITVSNVLCLKYSINTLISPIEIIVPKSMVKDTSVFSQTMNRIELDIKNLDEDSVNKKLLSLCDDCDLIEEIKIEISRLAKQLVDLERRKWNGVWARIITNFLSTSNLGRFDVIVGNPPWVDWKSLPSGYRERIKGLCISRQLFSGDKVTGGINLNICALITNVVAQNWLSNKGTLAFLMPEPLIFQQSYEGFRNLILADNDKLYFNKFFNWNKAGHPFHPVTQKFLTFFMSRVPSDYSSGVETICFIRNKGYDTDMKESVIFDKAFSKKVKYLATCNPHKNFFTYSDRAGAAADFAKIAGTSTYIGREGIEFYPQELMVFTLSTTLPNTNTCTALKNMQNKKSKYKVASKDVLLETDYLHPMIKGKDVVPFHVDSSKYIVPFPYEESTPKIPIELTKLSSAAPNLARYYQDNKKMIVEQTGYNDRIIGNSSAEFYALARVGAYSYAKNYVVFRDNTKWAAAVISDVDTDWGGIKHPVFQNHAVSICADESGRFISNDEAHYICGIMNTPIVSEYMISSSDSRSFPIRSRVQIPKFNVDDEKHIAISLLSKEAHRYWDDEKKIKDIKSKLNDLYLSLFV